MASGSGERPLGTPAQEKVLLGFSSTFNAMHVYMAANTTIYITLPTAEGNNYRQGLILIGGSTANKSGIYFYTGTNTTNLHVETILAPTATGVSVSRGGNTYLTITNGATALLVTVISSYGGRAESTSTQPT